MSDKRDEETIQTESNTSSDMERLTQMHEWIVKANSQILGPFSYEEVCVQLRDNRLVAHDEIIAPKGRWKLIRQEERFRSVVNEVKNRQTSADKATDATQSGSATVSGKFITPDGFNDSTGLMEGVEAKPLQADASPANPSRDLAKFYTYEKDPAPSGKTDKLKIVAALLVFVVAAVFYFVRYSPRSDSTGNHGDSFQEMLNQGIAAEKVGDYVKAMSFYSDARNAKPNDNELLIHLAPLTLTFEKQSLQAGRIFKQILDSDENPEHQKTALIGLGLVAMESREFDIALDYFDKVMKMEPAQTAATFNVGLIQFYKDKFSEAESYLTRALEKAGNDGAVVMALTDNSIAASQDGNTRGKLTPAHEMMKAYLEIAYDYRAQVLVEDAYVQGLAGRVNEASQSLDQALDVDPEQSDLFLRDWRFFRERSSWERSLDTLNRVLPLINSGPHMSALKGLVMFQGREKIQGAKEIEKALAQSPKDPLLLAISGWIGFKLGHKEEATVNIKEAGSMESKYRLPKLLLARLCVEEKDLECAQKNWEALMAADQRNLAAYHGLADLAWQKNDKSAAIRWLRQGQAMEPKYIPFNILSADIDASESDK